MLRIELNEEEKEILRETLRDAISDLGFEIADTEKMQMRERLKAKKAILMKCLKALEKEEKVMA